MRRCRTWATERTAQYTRFSYTDSKVSIQNIKRWAADPNLLNRDKHEDVLRDIAHRLAARTGHTRILKIMAHKGHPGNEAADRMAKMAATEP